MATVKIVEVGAGNVTDELADDAYVVFRSSNATGDALATAPLVKPNAGVARSYEKWLKVIAKDLVAADKLANFQLYVADGSAPAAGVSLQVGTSANKVNPAGVDSTVATADLFSKTSGAPLVLTVANSTYGLAAANPNNVIAQDGQIGPYIVLQMDLTSQATTGDFATTYGDIPISVKYDVIP